MSAYPVTARSAEFSPDGRYRYRLSRAWDNNLLGEDATPMVWVMLNPSTADDKDDDPTIRRCIGFAQRYGYVLMHVINLYAWRSSDPRDLGRVGDPVGPDNDDWIRRTLDGASVVAAWGAGAQRSRVEKFMEIVGPTRAVWCLGTTRLGQPRHPLYVPGETEFEKWRLP